MYLCGGHQVLGNWACKDLWKLDLQTLELKQLNSMREARNYVCLETLDQQLYAMGGNNQDSRLSSGELYNVEENQWYPAPSMKRTRSDAAVTVCMGKIYVLGGFDGFNPTNSVDVYNPLGNKWRSLNRPMNTRRSGVKAVSIGEKIYVVGGWDGKNRLKSGEVFDVHDKAWSKLPDMIVPRSNHCLEVLCGRLFAIGGYEGSTTTAYVEALDLETGVWSLVGTLPSSRSALSSCVVPAAAVQDQLRNHLECKEQYLDRRCTALRLESIRAGRNQLIQHIQANNPLMETGNKYTPFTRQIVTEF